jgi:hypothetical protein
MALDNIPTVVSSKLNANLDKVVVSTNGGLDVACSLINLANSSLNFAGVFLDTINQRVGIGTSTPTALLSVGGQSSFFSVQSAGTGSDFFYTDINPNITAGANNQVVSLMRLRDRGQANTGGFTGTQRLSLIMENAGGGAFPFQLFSETGALRIGFSTIATPTALVHLRGTGSTSATTSLLVQNSGGTAALTVTDDLISTFGGQIITPASVSGGVKFSPTNNHIIYGIGASIVFRANGTDFLANNATYSEFKTDGGTNANLSWSVGKGSAAVASALLEVVSTTRGFLPPRMTTAQKNAIATPAAGLVVYDTTLNKLCVYTTAWETITSS